MLRSIKEKIKEYNRSPKAYKPTEAELRPTRHDKTNEEDKGSLSVTQNIAIENNIMLKALLAEAKQNSSSIDRLNERMDHIEILVGKSLSAICTD